jgi:hypothetical protein
MAAGFLLARQYAGDLQIVYNHLATVASAGTIHR